LRGFFENVDIIGVADHIIDGMMFNVVPLRMQMHITVPKVQTIGTYGVDGVLGHVIPVYGGGKFEYEKSLIMLEKSDQNIFGL